MTEKSKWSGILCIMASVVFRAFGYHEADMIFGLMGALLWLYAGFREKDNALIVINGFISLVLLYGII